MYPSKEWEVQEVDEKMGGVFNIWNHGKCKAGSTSVCEWSMRDWGEHEQMPQHTKSGLFGIRQGSERGSILIHSFFPKRQNIHSHQYDYKRIFLWSTDSKRKAFRCSPNVYHINKYCSLHLTYTSTSTFLSFSHASFAFALHSCTDVDPALEERLLYLQF